MKAKQVFFGICVLLTLGLGACGNKDAQAKEETLLEYPILKVKGQEATLLSTFPATLKGQDVVEIRPRVEGFITKIYIDEGAPVRKGEALFKIESPESEQALISAEAAVKSANAQVNTAKVNVDRIRPLAEKNIISQTQLLTQENQYKEAIAAQKRAEAALVNAKVNMGWTIVTSPVDGVVGTISNRVGSLVNKANVVTTVASTSNIFAYFSLNEKALTHFLEGVAGTTQAEKIKNLPAVSLRLSDESIYEHQGNIETISGIIDVATGSANFRANFPNEKGFLRSGASGVVLIPDHVSNAIVIPQKATFEIQNKIIVYLLDADNTVKQHTISVESLPDGKYYIVTSGLKEGDVIVSDGIATLSQGKKIAIKK